MRASPFLRMQACVCFCVCACSLVCAFGRAYARTRLRRRVRVRLCDALGAARAAACDVARGGQVVNIHGGPWSRDQWGWNAEAQWFANRGYACIQVKARHAVQPCSRAACMQVHRTARCCNHTP